jgi:hypothetical protein
MANVTASSIAGPDAVLTNIRDFIVTLTGWTVHVNIAAPPTPEDSAGGNELIASKGDVLFGLRSTTTGTSNGNLFLFDGNGVWSAMDNIDEMTGNSGIRVTDAQYDDISAEARYWNEVGAGTWPNIWLFGADSPNYWHLVAEISTGIFRHMWVGELSPKVGSWTGGAYYGAQYWDLFSSQIDQPDSTSHAVPFDAQGTSSPARATTVHCETLTPTSSWVQPGATVDAALNSIQRTAGIGFGSRGNLGSNNWFNSGVSPLSGISFFAPVGCFFRDLSDNPDSFHHLGFVPDVKFVNMESLDPASTITIGSDTYRVFPIAAKNGAIDADNSGLYGYAYRVF